MKKVRLRRIRNSPKDAQVMVRRRAGMEIQVFPIPKPVLLTIGDILYWDSVGLTNWMDVRYRAVWVPRIWLWGPGPLQTVRPGEGSEKQPFTEVNKSTSVVNVELAFWLSGRPALTHSAC